VDRTANTNFVLTSLLPARRPGLRFSADERFLTYAGAGGDGSNFSQVYTYDFETGTNLLISRSSTSGSPGNGNSDGPEISLSGQYVAYRSEADNLAPGDGNDAPDVFLYDRISGNTTLVSSNRFGTGSGNGRSFGPVFAGDGVRLFFESSASDLVAQDFNETFDVFALNLNSPSLPFLVTSFSDGQNCCLQWALQPGKNYRVEFKSDLRQEVWQPAQGTVTTAGGTCSFKDKLSGSAQRFYRVVAY
jgi:hypothetical protein